MAFYNSSYEGVKRLKGIEELTLDVTEFVISEPLDHLCTWSNVKKPQPDIKPTLKSLI